MAARPIGRAPAVHYPVQPFPTSLNKKGPAMTTSLYTATEQLQDAVFAAYAARHGINTGRAGAGLVADADRAVADAEQTLAGIIPPDRRTRLELSARNMSTPDPRCGVNLAAQLRRAATYVAEHAAVLGVAPGRIDPGGFGACVCGGGGYCGTRGVFRDARRAVLGRGITPGRTVARLVLSTNYRVGSQAHVQGFAVDGCGGVFRCDFLTGGFAPSSPRRITPVEVERYMTRMGQPWRVVTRDEAADALVTAGYRVCGKHPHDFGPADAGSDVWRPSAADPSHVDHGALVAFVVATPAG